LAKKRKLDEGSLPIRSPAASAFLAKDVSFSIPQRKKLHLDIAGDAGNGYVFQVRNPATNDVEFFAPAQSITHILQLPVPEKAQRQYNYCILRTDGEPFVFTVNHGPLKDFSIQDAAIQTTVEGLSPELILTTVFDAIMQKTKVKVTQPDEEEFVAAVPESHRKTEKAYHVKAFRGSKDGR